MRFTKGPIKRLKEEVVPTLRFAERHFPNELLLASFPATDQPGSPDALIRLASSSVQLPLQVTCDWTYEDEQRLRTVHQRGSVFRVYSLEKVAAEVSGLIAKRLARKGAHGGAPGTWLVVHINDEHWPPEALPDVLNEARAAASGLPFQATFLVGSSDEKRICDLLDGTPVPPSARFSHRRQCRRRSCSALA
jgi:predicted nucleic acid-binding protein